MCLYAGHVGYYYFLVETNLLGKSMTGCQLIKIKIRYNI